MIHAGMVTVITAELPTFETLLTDGHRIAATREITWNATPLTEAIITGPAMPEHVWSGMNPPRIGTVEAVSRMLRHAAGCAAVTQAAAEFICEGCGAGVVDFGIPEPPAHGLCSVCAFLSEFVTDPDEFDAARRKLQQP